MTPNKEDYLKCIYELSLQVDKLSNKDIAMRMQVSAPAASEMLKKLVVESVIEKDRTVGFKLTQKGLLAASAVIRKHRLIESFLLNHLKYDVKDVHAEAEVLEHAVSEKFVDYLDAYLNYPLKCPHGGIIPRKNEILVENTIALHYAKAQKTYTLKKVFPDDRLFDYLTKHKVVIGHVLTIIDNDPFAQQMTVMVNDQTIVMSYVIASQLLVERVD